VGVTPYYDAGGITIYCGDCRDVMPGLTADLLITDPPYGFGAYHTDVQPPVWTGERAAVFGYPETLLDWIAVRGKPQAWIVWWPTNGACRGSFHSRSIQRETEHIAIWGGIVGTARVGKSTRAIDPAKYGCLPDRKCPDVWRDPAPGLCFNSRLRQHKNEKPLSLMTRLIALMGGDDTVLDPFMGSGTTLVAAKNLGRRAIGIEIEERYCEISARRLSQEVLPFEEKNEKQRAGIQGSLLEKLGR
jgi:site-specific DNA-methyltransferase (adenine-specific)